MKTKRAMMKEAMKLGSGSCANFTADARNIVAMLIVETYLGDEMDRRYNISFSSFSEGWWTLLDIGIGYIEESGNPGSLRYRLSIRDEARA